MQAPAFSSNPPKTAFSGKLLKSPFAQEKDEILEMLAAISLIYFSEYFLLIRNNFTDHLFEKKNTSTTSRSTIAIFGL